MDAGDLHPSDSPSPSQIKNPMDGEGGEGEGDGGETIKQKVQAATARLLHDGDKNVEVVVLGCAGMVGMEGWVREEISREVEGGGGKVKVLDGVKAGVGVLQGLVRGGY